MYQILLVEDDNELRQLFLRVLVHSGYLVQEAKDGREALEVLGRKQVDLIISDVMMPEMDGYELTRSLRAAADMTPVLMITAKSGFLDMQTGFQSGTDDYMVKPINVNEMVLRVGALLRRSQSISDRKQTFCGITLDYDSMTLYRDKKHEVLPQKEFLLLYKLISYPGQIFTRQQIMDDIWGVETETDPRTVDVHINRLRERFRDFDGFKIITVRGLGYKVVKRNG